MGFDEYPARFFGVLVVIREGGTEVAVKVGVLPSILTTEVAACPPIFSTLFVGPGKLMRR